MMAQYKWKRPTHNYKVGDIVLIKGEILFNCDWPLARVTKIFPGDKILTQIVNLLCQGKSNKQTRPICKQSAFPPTYLGQTRWHLHEWVSSISFLCKITIFSVTWSYNMLLTHLTVLWHVILIFASGIGSGGCLGSGAPHNFGAQSNEGIFHMNTFKPILGAPLKHLPTPLFFIMI